MPVLPVDTLIENSERWKRSSEFKRKVYFAVEDIRRAGFVARVFGVAIFVLIVMNALLVFVETQHNLSGGLQSFLLIFGLASSVCFGVEYAARLWVADLVRPTLPAYRARFRYAFSLIGLIDLLAFFPGLLVLVVPVSPSTLHAARIIRLIRLVKLSRYMRGLRSISRVFRKRHREIVAASVVLGLLTITTSVLMYQIENPVQPDKFDSVFTGMYWAMTTITTTGYGDLVPITPLGRFVGFATMLLSIGVVAIPAAIFSAGFVSEFNAQDTEARLLRKGNPQQQASEVQVELALAKEPKDEDSSRL